MPKEIEGETFKEFLQGTKRNFHLLIKEKLLLTLIIAVSLSLSLLYSLFFSKWASRPNSTMKRSHLRHLRRARADEEQQIGSVSVSSKSLPASGSPKERSRVASLEKQLNKGGKAHQFQTMSIIQTVTVAHQYFLRLRSLIYVLRSCGGRSRMKKCLRQKLL